MTKTRIHTLDEYIFMDYLLISIPKLELHTQTQKIFQKWNYSWGWCSNMFNACLLKFCFQLEKVFKMKINVNMYMVHVNKY